LRVGVALGLGLLVAVEYHPWRPTGISVLPGGGPEFETSRAASPRALWVPFWPGDSSYSGLYLYATTLTRIPMLNGYSAWLDRSYLTDLCRPLESVNLGIIGEAEAGVLRRYGVRQVILHRDAFPLKVSPLARRSPSRTGVPYLDPVETPSHHWALQVFRVRDAARCPWRRPHESSRRLLGGGVARARHRPRRRRCRRVERPGGFAWPGRTGPGSSCSDHTGAPARRLPRAVPAEGRGRRRGAPGDHAGWARHPRARHGPSPTARSWRSPCRYAGGAPRVEYRAG
jgi:hypothetical protein